MTTSLALLTFAIALATLGPRWLTRATWPGRSPALGMVAWLTLISSIFSSLILASLSLAVHAVPVGAGVVGFLHACSVALANHDVASLSVLPPAIGAITTVVLLGRFSYFLCRGWFAVRRDRERHLELLQLVGRPHLEPDVWVIRHPVATVYCLPGRAKRVVLTEAALGALSEEQLRQVLAHERAHIRARHHLLLLTADTLARTLSNKLGSRRAHKTLAELAEMHADDAAQPEHRQALASAVLVMAEGVTPASALAATGGALVTRVRRLTLPDRPVVGQERAVLLSAVAGMLLLPFVLAIGPALMSAFSNLCMSIL